jgi:hypothetical protein
MVPPSNLQRRGWFLQSAAAMRRDKSLTGGGPDERMKTVGRRAAALRIELNVNFNITY